MRSRAVRYALEVSRIPRVLAVAALTITMGCGPRHGGSRGGSSSGAVVVYTSLYPDVVAALKPVVESVSGERVEFVQGGSERIAKRLDAELASPKGSPADLLLTSDPAYYRSLATAGTLVAYESPAAAKQPDALKDPGHAFATARISAMVLGLAAGTAPPRPAAFKDLSEKEHAWKIAIGDPEFSGTNLLSAARLSSRLGWEFYRALDGKKALVAGSNGTVLLRLETGTSEVGILLLENLLASRAKGTKVVVVYPTDGAILIPGPVALLPHAKTSAAARAVYDAILSEKAQKVLVERGFMYSADPAMHAPADAPPLEKLLAGAPLASLYEPIPDRADVKSKFAKIFAR